MHGKRLMPGGLVALIWKTFDSVSIYLGIIANSVPEFLNAVKESATQLAIRVAFFDRNVESRISGIKQETRALARPACS